MKIIIQQDDTSKIFKVLRAFNIAPNISLKKGDVLYLVQYQPCACKLHIKCNDAASYIELNNTSYFELALRRGWVKELNSNNKLNKPIWIRVKDRFQTIIGL